ncbi:MAG TPA: energy transducer TonB [Candidatus Acidoferrales bacterium]|nr:energy transducer TonB [Candidatus Acidoferrales bacterium]
MKGRAATIGLASLLLAGARLPAVPQRGDPTALALFQKALAADIEEGDAPAFRMHGQLQVLDASGGREAGEVLRIWTPVGLRHEEIVLPDFQSVVVADGKNEWISSSADHTPFPIFQSQEVLTVAGQLRAGLQMAVEPPAPSAGGSEECVRAAASDSLYEFCFEAVTGQLTRVVSGLWNVTYEYSNYAAWGKKAYPRVLRVAKRDGETLVEIRIDRLAAESRPPLAMFLPGKGAREGADPNGCGKIDAARAEKVVKPVYPSDAQRAGITGTVRLYADIGGDGVPRGLWPLNSPSPILADAAIQAVRQWRYRPMVCHSTGAFIDAPTSIALTFSSR